MFNTHKRQKYYLLYTGIFLLLIFVAFLPFILENKTFIWGTGVEDGLSQHFSALVYWGQYLRRFASNVVQGKFYLPMWNMNLGYGADILQTLNYYAIGDPLNLVYGLVPTKYMEYAYDAMILLRMYLAGFCFMLYTKKMKLHDYSSILGAIVYVFCGFVFHLGIRHPFFLNPMIYYPLFCLGIEKIYRKEKPYLFIGVTAVAAISNFYFLYMLTILAVLYAWIRFYYYETEHRIKAFGKTMFKFGLYYIIGICMSAVILLPSVLGFLGNGRGTGGVKITSLLAYPVRFYVMLAENMIAYGNSGHNTNAGFIPIAGIAIALLLSSERMRHKRYKIAVLGCLFALCCPLIGYVLNGMSYASNRWGFAFGFYVAMLVAEMYPWFFVMTKKQLLRILGIIVFYIGIIIFGEFYNTMFSNPGAFVAGGLLFLFYLLFVVFQWKGIHYKNHMVRILVMALVIAGVGIHGYYRFSPGQGNYVSDFITRGKAVSTLKSQSCKMLKDVKDNGLYRVHGESQSYKNYGILNELNTISGYYSILDGNVAESLKSYQTLGMQYSDKFKGLDGRTGLLSLASVKYMSVDTGDKSAIPDGFTKVEEKDGVALYRNPYALPFGYTYSKYIREKQYEALNGVGREQSMLQYGVVEDNISSLSQGSVSEGVNVETLIFSQKHIRTQKSKMISKVHIPKHKGQTAYLYFHNLKFTHIKAGKKMEWLEGSGATKGIVVTQNGVSRNIYIQGEDSPYYFGRDDYMIPVEEGNVTLEYLSKGDYNIDDLRIVMTDSKKTKEYLAARKMNSLKNIKYKDNHFSGNITVNKPKLLCITIPYGKGWSAKVDGKETKILKTNGMYMGVVLEKGNHKIQLHYETPGIRIGFIISMIGFILFGVVAWMQHKRRDFE
ncbi:MAG: YfhO family protein [Anaerostipes sp.]|nr:YfhO family protein [Anaerostipes sp.]